MNKITYKTPTELKQLVQQEKKEFTQFLQTHTLLE